MAFNSSSDPMGNSRSCRSGLQKYCSKAHFYWLVPFYHSWSTSLSFKEVKMKEDWQAWYQAIGYVEGSGPSEVLSFQWKKSRIYNYDILSAFEHFEIQKLFGGDEGLSAFFHQSICAFTDNTNQLTQLQKALELENNHDLTIRLSILELVAPVVASVSAQNV